MKKQYFNPELAKVAGVNAAAVFEVVLDACKSDDTPLSQYQDGKRWVALPSSRCKEAVPYLSGNSVYQQLKKLEALGLIESACLNPYLKSLRFYSLQPDGEACDLD